MTTIQPKRYTINKKSFGTESHKNQIKNETACSNNSDNRVAKISMTSTAPNIIHISKTRNFSSTLQNTTNPIQKTTSKTIQSSLRSQLLRRPTLKYYIRIK